MSDTNDFSARFNTPILSEEDQARFNKWLASSKALKEQLKTYDLQGAWKLAALDSGGTNFVVDVADPLYMKPNHPNYNVKKSLHVEPSEQMIKDAIKAGTLVSPEEGIKQGLIDKTNSVAPWAGLGTVDHPDRGTLMQLPDGSWDVVR